MRILVSLGACGTREPMAAVSNPERKVDRENKFARTMAGGFHHV